MLKEAARVVGIGPGIVGCGAADHRAQTGWRDLLIVDGGPFFRTEYPQVTFKFASVGGEIGRDLDADVEVPRGPSKVTRRPRRSLRRAAHTKTGSTL